MHTEPDTWLLPWICLDYEQTYLTRKSWRSYWPWNSPNTWRSWKRTARLTGIALWASWSYTDKSAYSSHYLIFLLYFPMFSLLNYIFYYICIIFYYGIFLIYTSCPRKARPLQYSVHNLTSVNIFSLFLTQVILRVHFSKILQKHYPQY